MEIEKRLIDASALRAVLKNEECDCEVFPWALDNAPNIDAVEVAHGRWEYVEKTKDAKSGYSCSICCGPVWHAPDVPLAFRYCPNCGAKMDGGRE